MDSRVALPLDLSSGAAEPAEPAEPTEPAELIELTELTAGVEGTDGSCTDSAYVDRIALARCRGVTEPRPDCRTAQQQAQIGCCSNGRGKS